MVPTTGFEKFCGLDIYFALVFDPDNLIAEIDESNNIAMLGSAVTWGNINGMTCPPTASQTCKNALVHLDYYIISLSVFGYFECSQVCFCYFLPFSLIVDAFWLDGTSSRLPIAFYVQSLYVMDLQVWETSID